jgi:hypothetical protein
MYLKKETGMIKTSKFFFTTLLLSTFVFTNEVAASECYAPSPNLEKLGDKYYDFDDIKTFSDEEKDKLSRLFYNLSGKWKGKSIIVDCFGPDSAPEKKLKNAIIKTENQKNANGSLTINLNQKILEDRVNHSEVVTLLDPTNIFEFEFLSDNHLIFSEKYRRANYAKKVTANAASSNTETIIDKTSSDTKTVINTSTQPSKKVNNRSSRLIEIINEITLDNGTFTLIRSYYTNGVYTGEEAWSLQAQ